MDTKKEIKQEVSFQDFGSQPEGEYFSEGFVKKVKRDGSISDSDTNIKTELDAELLSSDHYPLKDTKVFPKDPVIKPKKCNSDSEIEQLWWQETRSLELPTDDSETKNEADTAESPRLYTQAVSGESDEGRDTTNFCMTKDSDNCEKVSKCNNIATETFWLKEGQDDMCKETSKRASSLKPDTLIQQNDPKSALPKCRKVFNCDTCDRCFIRLSDLKKHNLIHEGIKPHKCQHCEKTFTWLTSLKRHNLTHDGIKPHKCEICERSFSQSSHLKQHNLVHGGLKPYKCEICERTFSQVSNLKQHKLTHDGVKQYKCETCGKMFTLLPQLRRHRFIHEGVKPHKCHICDKTFTRLSQLKEHNMNHK